MYVCCCAWLCQTYMLRIEQGFPELFSAHRLDRLTSGALCTVDASRRGSSSACVCFLRRTLGIVLFGKSAEAAHHVTCMIADGKVHKCYLAKVSGEFPCMGEFKPPTPLPVVEADAAPPQPKRSRRAAKRMAAAASRAGAPKEAYEFDGGVLTMHCPIKSSRDRAVSRWGASRTHTHAFANNGWLRLLFSTLCQVCLCDGWQGAAATTLLRVLLSCNVACPLLQPACTTFQRLAYDGKHSIVLCKVRPALPWYTRPCCLMCSVALAAGYWADAPDPCAPRTLRPPHLQRSTVRAAPRRRVL